MRRYSDSAGGEDGERNVKAIQQGITVLRKLSGAYLACASWLPRGRRGEQGENATVVIRCNWIRKRRVAGRISGYQLASAIERPAGAARRRRRRPYSRFIFP